MYEDAALTAPVAAAEHLSIEEGQDFIVNDEDKLPLILGDILGEGASGAVQQVQDRTTGAVYACKTITFRRVRERAHKEQTFKDEVAIIRRLQHHQHVIRVFATFVAKKRFGLLLQPVADSGSLDEYLDEYQESFKECMDTTTMHMDAEVSDRKEDMMIVIKRAFGCLANALAYIHLRGIRHKDIKPHNILIHQGAVVLTDFGASRDVVQNRGNTTEGRPDALTKRYSPLEVLDHEKRNFSADVFSLGCVFAEMYAVLNPETTLDHDADFVHQLDRLHRSLQSTGAHSDLSFLSEFIVSMTASDPKQRPDMRSLAPEICRRDGFTCPTCLVESNTRRGACGWPWSPTPSHHYCSASEQGGEIVVNFKSNKLRLILTDVPASYVNRRISAENDGPVGSRSDLISSTYDSWVERYLVDADFHANSQHGMIPSPSKVQGNMNDDSHISPRACTIPSDQHVEFFAPGRILSMIWMEPQNPLQSTKTPEFSTRTHSEIRKFLVVANKGEYSQCILIRNSEQQMITQNPAILSDGHPDTYPSHYQLNSNPIEMSARIEECDPKTTVNGKYDRLFAVSHNVEIIGARKIRDGDQEICAQYIRNAMNHNTAPQWSLEQKKWLQYHWDDRSGRYFGNHFVEGEGWVFWQWYGQAWPGPVEYTVQPQYSSGSRLPRGTGNPINGEYAPGHLYYEKLDHSYHVRSRHFFTLGKVFAVMWSETAGSTPKPVDYNTSRSYSETKYEGNVVFTNVRRFVVVRRKREFCYACPIFTYSGRGCTKNGVHASEHAIAYSWGNKPQYVQEEPIITKPSIPVVMASGVTDLHVASRIYFGIEHPILYDVKVQDVGYVPADQIDTLISNWKEENQGTNQAADVTAYEH